jgi:DNA-binding transcriptional MerR regulator
MEYFTIKDIEHLSGIKAHTLRIWEQRYNVFTPQRKTSKHRIYDNEDLKKLLRIAFLYHNGWKISKIAALDTSQIAAEVRNQEINSKTYKTFIIQMIEAAVDFDEDKFVRIVDLVEQNIGFEKCIAEVCYPYLNRIGMLWVTNNVIPAQEHFSSYIIQNRIIARIESITAERLASSVVLLSPKGEYHELPVLFIKYLLRKNGWHVIYLGVNVQKEVVQQVVMSKDVEYIFVHQLTNLSGWEADSYFEDFCKTFSSKKIVAAGSVVQRVQRNFSNLTLLRSDKDVYQFVEENKIALQNHSI